MASNQAAWIEKKQSRPLQVADSDIYKPEADEIIIANKAIAVNPVDWKIQDDGYFVENFPAILGCDVAGEVHEVGSDVKDFKKGERVIGHAISLDPKHQKPNYGGFQHYTAVPAVIASKIPQNVSFQEGSVLPLALNTAIVGLYGKDYLGLPHPTFHPQPSNKVILVWGGSSSVGCCTVQLAKLSGITVVTTASSHNHDFVKSTLGADYVLDHKSSSVVDDIADAIKSSGKEFAGVYDAISLPASLKSVYAVIEKAGGSNKIVTVLPAQEPPSHVQTNGIYAVNVLYTDQEAAKSVWESFLYSALEKGAFKALPEPLVIGKGLEHVQAGVDKNKEGVSAKKVVIDL